MTNKEQVIEKLACFMCPVNFSCDGKGVKGCTGSLDKAHSFFKANPELVLISENQDTPSIPSTWGRCNQANAYALSQHDMKTVGFKKVIPIEEA